MPNDIEIVTAFYATFYVTVFIDNERCIAFGPAIFGKTGRDCEEKARNFLSHLADRFPHVNISSINTERLLVYYKEFLNEQVSARN